MRWSSKSKEELLKEIKKLEKELDVLTANDATRFRIKADAQADLYRTVEHLNMIGMTVERDGTVSYLNPFATRVLGWEEQELIGKNFFEVLVPENEKKPRLDAFLHALSQGGIFDQKERTFLTKSGQVRYVNLNSIIYNNQGSDIKSLTLLGEDVTDQRYIQVALNQTASQLQDLVDNTSDLIQIISMRGRFLYVNKSWREALGYNTEEVQGLNIRDVIHPDFLEKTLNLFQRIENGEALNDFETVLRRKNGRRLFVSGSVNCRYENGKPVAFRCILHNTTAKVRAERAQNLYYSIAQTTINSTDLNDLYSRIHQELGKVIDVKNFFIALYDSSKSYLSFPYYVDEAFGGHMRFTKRKLGNGLTEYAITKNKPLFLTEAEIHDLANRREVYLYGQVPKCLVCVPLRIGEQLTGIIGVKSYERTNKYDIRDLELLEFVSGQVALAIARKQSEEILNKQTARLNAIFESSSHLMWSVNKRLQLTSFNKDYADFIRKHLGEEPQLRVSPEQLGWRMMNLESRKTLDEKYKAALKGEAQHFNIQINNDSSTEIWYEIYLNPILLEDGVIEEVSGIARDISDLRKYSEELIKAKDEAEHSLKVKERFLANMSHEIRTPMNGVIGMIDLLSETQLSSDQRNYVMTIKKSSETLLNILNDILDLSKIEAGKMVLHEAPLSLQDWLDKLIALFSQAAHHKGNKLYYTIEEGVPSYIIADETRLLQILSNLTSNAIKFTEHGSIHVNVTKLWTKGRYHKVKVAVQDTGVGISEDNLMQLFNAFVQVDSSFTKSAGGTGLGLAISKQLAHLMKGETGVESKVGEGSTFWFTFETKETTIAPSSQSSGSGEFVVQNFLASYEPYLLLVDDNQVNRTVAKEILSKAGCVVDTADSGFKAIELVEANNFSGDKAYDLILMDIQMPEMDGVETTRRLRKINGLTLPPVIAMTAYSMKEDRDKFLNAGMDDYVPKPIRAQNLCQKVKEWMDKQTDTESIQKEKALRVKQLEKIEEVTHPVIDQEIVEQLKNLGGLEMVIGVFEDFENEAHQQITESKEAFTHNDLKTIQSHLHTLKGNAGTLGLARLHEATKALEAKTKVGNFNTFDAEITKVEEEFKIFQQRYKGFLENLAAVAQE
ncbi:MAG: PAS domain S-box protein [Spirosomataceae bacterium]